MLHSRTKHMEIDVFFVCERILAKQLLVRHILVVDQWANTLTKPLASSRFMFLRDKLNVVEFHFGNSPP